MKSNTTALLFALLTASALAASQNATKNQAYYPQYEPYKTANASSPNSNDTTSNKNNSYAQPSNSTYYVQPPQQTNYSNHYIQPTPPAYGSNPPQIYKSAKDSNPYASSTGNQAPLQAPTVGG